MSSIGLLLFFQQIIIFFKNYHNVEYWVKKFSTKKSKIVNCLVLKLWDSIETSFQKNVIKTS